MSDGIHDPGPAQNSIKLYITMSCYSTVLYNRWHYKKVKKLLDAFRAIGLVRIGAAMKFPAMGVLLDDSLHI